MNCRNVRKLIAGYVGGDLPPDDAEAVRAHLAGCAACRAEQAGLEQSLAALHRAVRPIPPPPRWGRAGVGVEDLTAPHPDLPPQGGKGTANEVWADAVWQGVRGRIPSPGLWRRVERRSWWRRPVPLPVGLAAAATLLAATGLLLHFALIGPRVPPNVPVAPPAAVAQAPAYLPVPPPPFVLENATPTGGSAAYAMPSISPADLGRDQDFVLDEVRIQPVGMRRMQF